MSLDDKNTREKYKLIISFFVTVPAAIIALIYGTAYIDKVSKEYDLSSKFAADTNLTFFAHPYKTEDGEVNFCEVTGSYSVKNIGKYPYTIKSIRIQLWELPYIQQEELDSSKVISFSIDQRLKPGADFPAIPVGDPVDLDIGERFATTNLMEKSYGFIVPVSPEKRALMDRGVGSRYIVEANGVAQTETKRLFSWLFRSKELSFLDTDLRHTTSTFNICFQPKS